MWVEGGAHIFRDRGDQKEVKMEILKNLGHFVQDVQTEIEHHEYQVQLLQLLPVGSVNCLEAFL